MGEHESSLSTVTSAEMDPGIWSRLPQEILEHVLSLLPLKTFLNLRSTCKRFKSLLFSPTFVCKHSSSSSSPSSHSSPFSSFLLLLHPPFRPHYLLYDTVQNAWRNFSLPIFPLQSCVPTAATLLSSSNGLLCFALPNSSFLVCNLLTRSSRTVELPITHPFDKLTLVSASKGGYKLFLVSSYGSSKHAHLYDSSTHLWQQFEGFDPIISVNYHREGVFYNGCLYFTTPEPFSVVSFDLEAGKWKRSTAELPGEGQLTFLRLVGNNGQGRFYFFGGIGRNGISRSMKLWEYSETENRWSEVGSVPELMCKKFLSVCYHNYEHVYCFWHQGMICVCCHTWPEILFYRVARKAWHWVPKCPSLPEKWSCGFRWFSFVPELYAFV